jgi:hypothetical protein
VAEAAARAVSKEMALTAAELERALPALAQGRPWQRGDGGVIIDDGLGRIRIGLTPLPERRLGHLRLPRARVEIAFDGIDPARREAFLRRFGQVTQRGGG